MTEKGDASIADISSVGFLLLRLKNESKFVLFHGRCISDGKDVIFSCCQRLRKKQGYCLLVYTWLLNEVEELWCSVGKLYGYSEKKYMGIVS